MSKNNKYNKDGQRHGLWEKYWDNNQLMYKGVYVNGKKHGLWEHYHGNGQFYCKCTYVNGKEHGLWKHYNRDGTIEKQVFYSKYYEQD